MSKGACLRKGFLQRPDKSSSTESDGQSFLTRHLKKIYPIGLDRSTSSLSLSSVSLSLSQSSNDSASLAGSLGSSLDRNIYLALRLISPYGQRSFVPPCRSVRARGVPRMGSGDGELRRCNWITKSSDKAYVEFHDECWGVPIYDDSQLFELLAMAGMLMDYNWTEILKRKESFREAFCGFDPDSVARMGEDEIERISTDKAVSLAESRVRCIVENAKCIQKVGSEYGSFSDYAWSYVNHKPTINEYRYSKQVPLRSPKAEAMSKDLQRRGFRLVGPVIVHSFMQAAGMTIDHLVDCYRYAECVNLAETPWRHG
ncbi:hypothetical protein MLD38_017453 [Melastoma candidum]|uniref:Uncharacterized protein n=1 Tax=Melastoma candidum TaxID=119954 RepID=A0ACB9QQU8_9MYRT|nr:hypothetical protein MLD38_017453 [Melastoma candidum]